MNNLSPALHSDPYALQQLPFFNKDPLASERDTTILRQLAAPQRKHLNRALNPFFIHSLHASTPDREWLYLPQGTVVRRTLNLRLLSLVALSASDSSPGVSLEAWRFERRVEKLAFSSLFEIVKIEIPQENNSGAAHKSFFLLLSEQPHEKNTRTPPYLNAVKNEIRLLQEIHSGSVVDGIQPPPLYTMTLTHSELSCLFEDPPAFVGVPSLQGAIFTRWSKTGEEVFRALTLPEKLSAVRSLFKGLNELHSRNIVHGDIGLESVRLIDGKFVLGGLFFARKKQEMTSDVANHHRNYYFPICDSLKLRSSIGLEFMLEATATDKYTALNQLRGRIVQDSSFNMAQFAGDTAQIHPQLDRRIYQRRTFTVLCAIDVHRLAIIIFKIWTNPSHYLATIPDIAPPETDMPTPLHTLLKMMTRENHEWRPTIGEALETLDKIIK